ncbi:MAG: PEP-CTERM sorting domain-containing protein [Planctomycetia bacterium]|nr:PEP-CTERM sorting domain-containing protein [Planctomycetia bacterium]
MRRTFSATGIVLVASLAFVSQAFCGPPLPIPYGTATVDGDLSDWSGAIWNVFDTVYDGVPDDINSEIVDGGWTARWTAKKVYMAVKVRDTAHCFTDSYTAWDAKDAVELYIHTTGTVIEGEQPCRYDVDQEGAQEWAVGMKTAADGSVWTTNGYPPGYGEFEPTPSQIVAAGSIDGEWLYYEAAMTPFEYFGGRKDPVVADVVSELGAGMTIGLDCTAVGVDPILGYRGMKISALDQSVIGSWFADWSRFSQHELLPKPSPEPGDANSNGLVDDQDASILGSNWQLQLGATWAMGDFNEDGMVNDKDAAIMAAHWTTSEGNEGSVPEPSTVILLISAGAALWFRRRR